MTPYPDHPNPSECPVEPSTFVRDEIWDRVSWTGWKDSDAAPAPGRAYVTRSKDGRCDRTGVWRLFHCDDHGFYVAHTPCTQLDCATCAATEEKGDKSTSRTARSRGARMYERVGGVGLAAWVLTLPREWHGRIGPKRLRIVRTLAARTLQAWYRWRYGVAIGLYAQVHPEGDHRPGEWCPHIHLGVAMVGARDSGLVPLPEWLDAYDLATVRAAWGQVLAALADQMGWERPPANLHYSYRTTPAERMHRMRYDLRPFPVWSGRRPSDDPLSVRYVRAIPSGVLAVGSYGLLSPGSRHPRVEQWRAAVAGQVEERETRCPVCETPIPCVGLLSVRVDAEADALWALVNDGREIEGQRAPP